MRLGFASIRVTQSMENYVSNLMAEVKAKNPGESEFHQAVQEVVARKRGRI